VEGLNFLYHDLPEWATWWKKGGRGLQLYYYLWQLTAISKVRKGHAEIGFDLSHHVTFVRYWAPSCLAWLDIPFVWGPIGGGDSTPISFLKGFGLSGCIQETLRAAIRILARFDPFVRANAKRCTVCIPVTRKTGQCVEKLNNDIQSKIVTQVGLSEEELLHIDSLGCETTELDKPVFLYVGNLIPWKGVRIAIMALAEANILGSELWIVGDGADRGRLSRLARRLRIDGQVKFHGQVSRDDVLITMKRASVLVHPSLHDSGGFVLVEAMACEKPVICLDLAGPRVLVPEVAGIRIKAVSERQSVMDMAQAMRRLARDPALRKRMGDAGREHARQNYLWMKKAELLESIYKTSVPL